MPKIEKDLLKVKGSDGQWHYIPAVGGSSTPTWNAVQNKPFESLGDGLSVKDGVLSAQGTGGSANAVQYVAQTLTDEQKTQARENIEAPARALYAPVASDKGKYFFDSTVGYNELREAYNEGAAVYLAVGIPWTYIVPLLSVSNNTMIFAYFDTVQLYAIKYTVSSNSSISATFDRVAGDNVVSQYQGAENAGKILGVGEDGNVVPQDKPTYTAGEVGALPNTTVIPTVPATLPNPQKLTFTGAVTGEYDGSSALTVDIPQGGDSLVIPEQRIALDNAMLVGPVTHVGTVIETNTDYRHTEKIKLNSHKSFQLTGKDASGNVIHIALRYVTAYDADGKVISAYSLQNVAEASASAGRVVQMDTAVDSVIVSIYKPERYTDKTFILPSVVRDIASALAGKITAPTTAAVGQIIKVKSVDNAGKPTEWEAADLGEKVELIASGTIEEVASLVVTKDSDGNALSLKNCYVVINGTLDGEGSTSICFRVADNTSSTVWDRYEVECKLKKDNPTIRATFVAEQGKIPLLYTEYDLSTVAFVTNDTTVQFAIYRNNATGRDFEPLHHTINQIIVGNNQGAGRLGAGTKYEIYGVRI